MEVEAEAIDGLAASTFQLETMTVSSRRGGGGRIRCSGAWRVRTRAQYGDLCNRDTIFEMLLPRQVVEDASTGAQRLVNWDARQCE